MYALAGILFYRLSEYFLFGPPQDMERPNNAKSNL